MPDPNMEQINQLLKLFLAAGKTEEAGTSIATAGADIAKAAKTLAASGADSKHLIGALAVSLGMDRGDVGLPPREAKVFTCRPGRADLLTEYSPIAYSNVFDCDNDGMLDAAAEVAVQDWAEEHYPDRETVPRLVTVDWEGRYYKLVDDGLGGVALDQLIQLVRAVRRVCPHAIIAPYGFLMLHHWFGPYRQRWQDFLQHVTALGVVDAIGVDWYSQHAIPQWMGSRIDMLDYCLRCAGPENVGLGAPSQRIPAYLWVKPHSRFLIKDGEPDPESRQRISRELLVEFMAAGLKHRTSTGEQADGLIGWGGFGWYARVAARRNADRTWRTEWPSIVVWRSRMDAWIPGWQELEDPTDAIAAWEDELWVEFKQDMQAAVELAGVAEGE